MRHRRQQRTGRRTLTSKDGTRHEAPVALVPSLHGVGGMLSNRNSSGYKAVSTFSGCGGSSLGLKWAGIDVLWANEFVKAARETYRANECHTFIDDRDIREVQAHEILNIIGLDVGQLDVLEGSPPCASFSTASGAVGSNFGKAKEYSDTSQVVDDLFYEFARLLQGLQPRVFIAENVASLVQGRAKGYFKRIMTRLHECGYVVSARVLDAAWLGVAQIRKRLIIVGMREDLELAPVFPIACSRRVSVAEVLPNIETIRLSKSLPWVTAGSSPSYTLVQSDARRHLSSCMSSGGWCSGEALLGEGVEAQVRRSGEPEGSRNRKFTIPELRRISGIPDDFLLTGTFDERWERLGRCVPPPMMRAIGLRVVDALKEYDRGRGQRTREGG